MANDDLPPEQPGDSGITSPVGALTADDKQWGMFAHLSALLGLIAGTLTFLGPLIVWLIKKDQSKFVDYHGKEALNFHLNILGYNIIAWIISLATCFVASPLIVAVMVYSIVMSIIAGMKANEGRLYEYPAIVRLIK
jgi:uncharacterized protein